MKRIFTFFALVGGTLAQGTFSIPFDWGGQNGIVITEGTLFWNRSWTSGMLLFDGTYSSYPRRYGVHTSNRFEPLKAGFLPGFSDLPDSSDVETYFDYKKGDYLYDQMEIGADFEQVDRHLRIRGFKRNHGGNTGHYLYPSGGSTPIHHSYRVDYASQKGERKMEISTGRFITRSGLPDSTSNGMENENIIAAGLRFQRPVRKWTVDTYLGQFFQHHLIHHSSLTDSNYMDINRGILTIQLESPSGIKYGISQESQQVSNLTHNRSLNWTKVYGTRSFGNLTILGGVQILNSDDAFPFVWQLDYRKNFKKSYLQFTSSGSPNPKHPDLDDPTDNSSFEFWGRNMVEGGFTNGSLKGNTFLSVVQNGGEHIVFLGGRVQFGFGEGWSIYNLVFTQIDSSIYGGGLGTATTFGLRGKLNLFKDNMKIDAHLWGNGIAGLIKSFGFDPIRQIPFRHGNSAWSLPNQWLLHFEAVANISGVLVSYKVNNVLNAVTSIGGVSPNDDLIWIRPNHVYPQLGRMMQFGITWYFKD